MDKDYHLRDEEKYDRKEGYWNQGQIVCQMPPQYAPFFIHQLKYERIEKVIDEGMKYVAGDFLSDKDAKLIIHSFSVYSPKEDASLVPSYSVDFSVELVVDGDTIIGRGFYGKTGFFREDVRVCDSRNSGLVYINTCGIGIWNDVVKYPTENDSAIRKRILPQTLGVTLLKTLDSSWKSIGAPQMCEGECANDFTVDKFCEKVVSSKGDIVKIYFKSKSYKGQFWAITGKWGTPPYAISGLFLWNYDGEKVFEYSK